MARLPTVRIMRGETPVRINASDFRYGRDALAPGEKMPRGAVAKDAVPPPIPEGLKAQVETGAPVYDPRNDATREAAGEQPVAIPADWNEMHWKSRQKLAEEIDPDFVPDPASRVPSIDAFIKAEIAKRSAGGDQ